MVCRYCGQLHPYIPDSVHVENTVYSYSLGVDSGPDGTCLVVTRRNPDGSATILRMIWDEEVKSGR